jgi:hypothetical protein
MICPLVKQVILEESLPTVSTLGEDNGEPLTNQLFDSHLEGEETSPWNELVTQKWRDLSRKGLPANQCNTLLNKYSPPEAVAFLKYPL